MFCLRHISPPLTPLPHTHHCPPLSSIFYWKVFGLSIRVSSPELHEGDKCVFCSIQPRSGGAVLRRRDDSQRCVAQLYVCHRPTNNHHSLLIWFQSTRATCANINAPVPSSCPASILPLRHCLCHLFLNVLSPALHLSITPSLFFFSICLHGSFHLFHAASLLIPICLRAVGEEFMCEEDRGRDRGARSLCVNG